ncbi:hypothetical protein NQZ68_022965 [Dissostichus eleginoides]|nr:hypothetical protein NQZ68_022965 [Dissostichus eleginoides]
MTTGLSQIVLHLCQSAIANQWTDTNLEGSEIEKRASSIQFSSVLIIVPRLQELQLYQDRGGGRKIEREREGEWEEKKER